MHISHIFIEEDKKEENNPDKPKESEEKDKEVNDKPKEGEGKDDDDTKAKEEAKGDEQKDGKEDSTPVKEPAKEPTPPGSGEPQAEEKSAAKAISNPQEEYNENVTKFREQVLEDDDRDDLKGEEIYEDIRYEINQSKGAPFKYTLEKDDNEHADRDEASKLIAFSEMISDAQAVKIFKKNVKKYEHESWLMEGFPKTRVQALALAQNKVIPDKIFLMKYSDEVAADHVFKTLQGKYGDDPEREEEYRKAAWNAVKEYHMHIKGVQDVFKNVIHIIDAHGYVKGYGEGQNKISHFADQLSRLITIKRMSPDRRQRIIVIGAPGSGRSTQASILAKQFGLVHISTSNLLKNEIRLKTERGKRIKDCFAHSKLVPDEIICSLVEARIKQSDCKLNGWVLDGFPKTIQQITVLKAMKIKPTRVIMLQCDKQICADRILKRSIDTVTGKTYNMIDEIPKEPEILNRLVPYFSEMTEDKVSKRWDIWNQFQVKVEESYQEYVLKFNTEEYTADQVSSQICEFIQNPIF